MDKDEAIKEIKQLKELLDSGILTQDEHDVKSAELKRVILDSEKKNDEASVKKKSNEQEESLWQRFLLGWSTSFRNLDPKNPREEWKCCRDRAITIFISLTLFGLTDQKEPYWGLIAAVAVYFIPLPFAYFYSIFLNIPLIFRVISGKIAKKSTERAKYENEVLSNLSVEIFWTNIGKRNRFLTFFATLAIIVNILIYLFD